MESELSCLVV